MPQDDPAHRVFVSVARPLPSGLTFQILDALQSSRVEPFVYGGVPKRQGNIASNVYVEARGCQLKSELLVLVLADDGTGLIADDWAFEFVPGQLTAKRPVLAYLMRSETIGPETRSATTLEQDGIITQRFEVAESMVATMVSDVFRLFRVKDH